MDVTDLDSQDLSQPVIVIKTSVLILCCYVNLKSVGIVRLLSSDSIFTFTD